MKSITCSHIRNRNENEPKRSWKPVASWKTNSMRLTSVRMV